MLLKKYLINGLWLNGIVVNKILFSLILLLMAGTVNAAGCVAPKNAFDQVYCAGNLFTQVDHDLNVEYTHLKKMLKPNEQASLKQGQLKWIKTRNDQCSKEDATGYFVNLDCAVTLTSDRLSFLKERARECSSTGCVVSKIGEL